MRPLSDAAVGHLAHLADWPDLNGTRYTAIEELGRGGMGAVFRARDERLGRDVAVKVLRAADLPGDLGDRLGREAGILSRLEHPGIVPVHDLGTLPDGRVFYVMKLVRGRRLDAWLAGDPGLRERLDLLRRVAETVAFANAHGVVHRDLKPSNIMVGEFGEVLVLDWGVAKVLTPGERRVESGAGPSTGTVAPGSSLLAPVSALLSPATTGHGTVLGTEGFMAPEQERGDVEAIDQRTDVFGLGALLRAMVPERPRRLEAIAARATAPLREARYPDATALARDLARFQDGAPVEAYRESVLERLERIMVRYRTPILLVVVYLLMRALFIIFREP